jgi:hypothetical protein
MGLTILGVAAFAVAVAFNISAGLGSNAQMDVALANIEALATSEINPDCPNGCLQSCGDCYCYQHYYLEEKQW